MISLYHLRAWASAPGARMVAICDLDETKARTRAAEFGIERVYTDPARMFAVDLLGRYQESFDYAVRSFVEGVRDGTSFETDRKDNLETMRLMESVYLAASIKVNA